MEVCVLKKQGFLKGSAILLAMVVITKALGLMYRIPLTHLLGGTGMGYYSSAYAVFTPIFAIVVSGIPSTIARMVAENYAFERYRNVRKIKRTAMIIFSAGGIFATLAFAMLSFFLSENVIHETNAVWSLMAVAPSIIFGSIISVERGYYEGLKNMIPTAISEIIETIFKLALGLSFAYIVMNYAETAFFSTGKCFGEFCNDIDEARATALPFVTGASIFGVTVATGISSLYLVISGKIQGDGITKQMLQQDKYTDKTAVIISTITKYALPIIIASVITTFTNMIDMLTINPCINRVIEKNSDIFSSFINENLTVEMLPNFIYGSYTGLAVTIFGLVPTLTAMFGKSILPELTEYWAKKNQQQVQKSITNTLSISSIIAIPSGIGIFLLSKEILEFLFGGRVSEIAISTTPLTILGLGVVFLGISIPCFSILQTIGKPKLPIIIMLTGGVIKLILNCILIPIPILNVSGAALSTLISQAVICIWSVIAMLKSANVTIDTTAIFAKPLFSAILCGCTARLTIDIISNISLFTVNHRILLALAITNGSIIYFFSLYLLCVLPKKQIKALFYKKISKNY